MKAGRWQRTPGGKQKGVSGVSLKEKKLMFLLLSATRIGRGPCEDPIWAFAPSDPGSKKLAHGQAGAVFK